MESAIDVSRTDAADCLPGFPASLSAWDFGGIGLVSMSMPGIGYGRKWSQVRRPASDHWSLMMPLADGWRHPYAPRSLYVSSLGRLFSGGGTDTDVISLFVARDHVPVALAAKLDRLSVPLQDVGTAGLLMDLLVSLRGQLRQGLDVKGTAIEEAVLSLLDAAMAPSSCSERQSRLAQRLLARERILRYIRANLRSPELDIAALCAAFNLSRSGLFRIFEDEGVQATILRERLMAIRHVLENGEPVAINSLAAEYGFQDASGFSRIFKSHFGLTPTEARPGRVESARRLGELDKFLIGLSE